MNDSEYRKEKVKEWLKKGDSDFRSAEILIKDVQPPTDTACFHCHQAAEKYLKGYLTSKDIQFAKSHDLDYLSKLCTETCGEFESLREEILILNKYGIEPRYPADIPLYYSVEETKKSIDLAKEIIGFIKGAMKAGLQDECDKRNG